MLTIKRSLQSTMSQYTFGSTAPFAEPLWYSRGASPHYKDSHRQLRKVVREYVDSSIAPFCEEWESQGSIPTEVLERHAQLGYQAAAIYPLPQQMLDEIKLPGDIKGRQWDAFHDLIIIDEIARCGYLGVIWGLTCGNQIGCPPLVNFGTEEQMRRFLPDVYAGRSRFCLGVTEPDAGSDVANITTTAVRKGDLYVVNGAKKWITNGMSASFTTAAVRTGGPGKDGISALVIPLNVSGVTKRRIPNSGVNASGSTYLEFDDVEVPISNLLGKENDGFKIIMSNFNHERLWLACTSLRMARVCAEDAYAYATSRETFGKKLISNQLIRAKISTFGRTLEPAHAYMEQLVHMLHTTKDQKAIDDLWIGGLIANLKVLAGRALELVNREAQQILGGAGYSKNGKGARVEQISRDVRVMVVGGGSEEILQDLAVVQEMKASRARLSKL